MHLIRTKGILSADNGINFYRGCTHGCIYCDSRSACYHMDHAFEDVAVKETAVALLEQALKRKRTPCMLATGAMTDPYQPLEREVRSVHNSLILAEKYGFGFTVLTKSAQVLEDLPLLRAINEKTKCVVQMTLTTYDEALCRKLEPNVSTTRERVQTLFRLRDAGIPTVVWLCPVLPFLTDTEENIRGILSYCAEASVYGVICFGMGMTLREGNREYFYRQLDRLFPGLKQRYIRDYGNRYQLSSPNSCRLMALFHEFCEKAGMIHDNETIFRYLRTFEDRRTEQLSFFEK